MYRSTDSQLSCWLLFCAAIMRLFLRPTRRPAHAKQTSNERFLLEDLAPAPKQQALRAINTRTTSKAKVVPTPATPSTSSCMHQQLFSAANKITGQRGLLVLVSSSKCDQLLFWRVDCICFNRATNTHKKRIMMWACLLSSCASFVPAFLVSHPQTHTQSWQRQFCLNPVSTH